MRYRPAAARRGPARPGAANGQRRGTSARTAEQENVIWQAISMSKKMPIIPFFHATGRLDCVRRTRCFFLPRPTWLLAKPSALLMRNDRSFYGSPLKMASAPERIEAGCWSQSQTWGYFIPEGQDHAHYWVYRERLAGTAGTAEDAESRWFCMACLAERAKHVCRSGTGLDLDAITRRQTPPPDSSTPFSWQIH